MPVVWTFLAIVLAAVGVREMVTAPHRRLHAMLDRVGRTEAALPFKARLVAWLKDSVIRRIPLLPGAGSVEELRSLVLWAGRPGGLGAEEFYFLQILLAGAFFLLGWSFGLEVAALGAAIGLIGPRQWLRARVAEKTRAIRRELPQFVHLMATCMEAGMGLSEAVRRVAQETPGTLAKEMHRTVYEIAAGKPSQRAWADLMERTNCGELKEIVTSIMQSQEYGVGIAEQLRFTMRAIRQRKQQQAQQKAQEASVKMRLPMVLCILFPTLMIVLGPSAVNVIRLFGGQ